LRIAHQCTNKKREMMTKKQGKTTFNLNLKRMLFGTVILTSAMTTLMMLFLSDSGPRPLRTPIVSNDSKIHLYLKKNPASVNVEALRKNMDTHRTTKITVCKTAQHAAGELAGDGEALNREFTVYETRDPMGVRHYWSQEKQGDRLVLQHSTSKENVIKKLTGEARSGEETLNTDPELKLQETSALGAVPRSYIL